MIKKVNICFTDNDTFIDKQSFYFNINTKLNTDPITRKESADIDTENIIAGGYNKKYSQPVRGEVK